MPPKRRNLLAPQPDFKRDRWQRPLIIPQGADESAKPVSYMRVTRYVGVIEDMFNLQRWEKRMVALGLAEREDLRLAVAAHRDDKGKLNDICDRAKEAARANAGSTTGTALHALTDMIDRGEQLPTLPPGAAASLEKFAEATKPLKVKAIELHVVQDVLEAAGTADRLYEIGTGRKKALHIGDTKSGSIDLGILKIAMQLALYARSWAYDVTTGERWAHEADLSRGIIMHLPATDDPAEAKCELYWVDLLAGWNEVRVCRDIWKARKAKFGDLTEPFTLDPTEAIKRQIAACKTADEVRAVYSANRVHWSNELNTLAAERAQLCDSLPGATAGKAAS